MSVQSLQFNQMKLHFLEYKIQGVPQKNFHLLLLLQVVSESFLGTPCIIIKNKQKKLKHNYFSFSGDLNLGCPETLPRVVPRVYSDQYKAGNGHGHNSGSNNNHLRIKSDSMVRNYFICSQMTFGQATQRLHSKHRKGKIADMYECCIASLATRKSTISIQF